MTPIAAAIAVIWLVPFYRRSGEVSAYEHLEHRFGPWARTYAVVCFLLVQMARTGAILYLLSLAFAPLTGWDVYSDDPRHRHRHDRVHVDEWHCRRRLDRRVAKRRAGGRHADLPDRRDCQNAGRRRRDSPRRNAPGKIWPGDFQRLHCRLAAVICDSAFWVVLCYGLVMNVSNFATDQSYVQRYITARDDREAKKGVWLTALLYVPVAAIFFFIGTGLFVFYQQRPELLEAGIAGDKVFPLFISKELPVGLAGLVIAAILAASMDPNLNSMATLTYCDIYQRYFRPRAGEREAIFVLRTATLAWGAICTAVGIGMTYAQKSLLDAWWELSGIFSGGVLGLFLLGVMSRRVTSRAAAVAVTVGVLVILWAALSPTVYWPEAWKSIRNPLHPLWTVVLATGVVLIIGLAGSCFSKPAKNTAP